MPIEESTWTVLWSPRRAGTLPSTSVFRPRIPIGRSSRSAGSIGAEGNMPNVTPFLWFDSQAEEAAEFYVSIFPNSKITEVSRYGEAGPGPVGSAMVVAFELDGSQFLALNGGPD